MFKQTSLFQKTMTLFLRCLATERTSDSDLLPIEFIIFANFYFYYLLMET